MTRHPLLLAAGAACLLVAALVAGCGKKGDPEPPIRMIPAPTTGLTVVQRGEELLVELPYPQTTAAGTPLARVGEVAVWLLVWRAPEAAAAKAPPEVDERQFLAGAQPARMVSGEELPEVVRGDRIVVALPVPAPPAEGAGRPVVTLAAKTQGPTGEESALSNRVTFPLIEPPAPPTGLEARDLAGGIRVRWDYPLAEGEEPGEEGEAADEEGVAAEVEEEELEEESVEPEREEPSLAESEEGEVAEEAAEAPEEGAAAEAGEPEDEPGLAGFNVYRRRSTERTYGPPLRALGRRSRSFLDDSAVFGGRYIYAVTAVASRRPVVVESRLAEETEVDYRDRFAPPVPRGLVALAEEGRVRLVWEASAAPDLAGYRVYRRGPDTQELVPVTADPVTATEYADRDLTPGATYTYRVTAVDRLGNESDRSPPATAMAR
jgi:hypothetical protein